MVPDIEYHHDDDDDRYHGSNLGKDVAGQLQSCEALVLGLGRRGLENLDRHILLLCKLVFIAFSSMAMKSQCQLLHVSSHQYNSLSMNSTEMIAVLAISILQRISCMAFNASIFPQPETFCCWSYDIIVNLLVELGEW